MLTVLCTLLLEGSGHGLFASGSSVCMSVQIGFMFPCVVLTTPYVVSEGEHDQ
jgi:hypothetical protein